MLKKSNIFGIFLIVLMLLISTIYIEYPKYLSYENGLLDIYFLNIGQGDSILIKTPNSKLILIDGGPSRAVMHRLSEILPFWISKIDLVIATHSHSDHITGLLDVIESYEVKCLLYFEDDLPTTLNEEALRKLILEGSVRKVNYDIASGCIEDELIIKNFNLAKKISGNNSRVKDENTESIITELTYDNFDALFTADATILMQQEVLPQLEKDFEVIKVAHQGSRLSLNKELVSRISPEVAVVTVGFNFYGHPHNETLDFYKSKNIDVYRTDQVSSYVHIQSNGEGFIVEAN